MAPGGSEGKMTDPDLSDQGLPKADTRLRALLSSWQHSRGYRPEVATHYRNRSIRPARYADLNRELAGPRYIEWQWFLIPLLALTIIDFFYLQHWR